MTWVRVDQYSHIVVEKADIFWEGRVDSWRVAYRCLLGGGIFWEGGVEFGKVAYVSLKAGRNIVGGMVRFSERRI